MRPRLNLNGLALGRMCCNWVSLKLAVTQMSLRGTTESNSCPTWTFCADLCVAVANHAVNRRDDHGVAEIELA